MAAQEVRLEELQTSVKESPFGSDLKTDKDLQKGGAFQSQRSTVVMEANKDVEKEVETPRFESEEPKKMNSSHLEDLSELQRKLKQANERALNFEKEFIIAKSELTSEISKFNKLHSVFQHADKTLNTILSKLTLDQPSSPLLQQIRAEKERFETLKEDLVFTPRHSMEGVSPVRE